MTDVKLQSEIIQGDVRDVLAGMTERSVQCVVTSPPYWGLRDYGVEGQLGLEATPEEYIEDMVAVFREVRRVLRDDGTCWINLGSSYASSRPAQSEAACGTDGKAPQDSQASGHACHGSGDEPQDDCQSHPRCTSRNGPPLGPGGQRSELTAHDSGIGDSASVDEPCTLPDALASTRPSSTCCEQDACDREAKAAACPPTSDSACRGALSCGCTKACTCGIAPPLPPSDHHKSDTELSDSASDNSSEKDPIALTLLYSTIAALDFKPKDLIPMPFLLALALQADGWYLRSDIIWSKPNPMPESGRCSPANIDTDGKMINLDRPTKAHEYLFLLTKRPTYFWDAEAVREKAEYGPTPTPGFGGNFGGHHTHGTADVRRCNPAAGRNIRTVWTTPYDSDTMTAWTTRIGFCRKCGGLRVAGNGSEPMILTDMDGSPETTELSQGNSGRTESPTSCLLGQSGRVSRSTTCAETKDASTQHISNPSQSERTSCEEIRQQPETPPRHIAQPDINTRLRTLMSVLTGGESVVPVCVCDGVDSSQRSVWKVPTQSYSDAHFATFPEKLVEPCVRAGTSAKGCCPECGAPWVRVVEKNRVATRPGINTKCDAKTWDKESLGTIPGRLDGNVIGNRDPKRHVTETTTTGWRPGCECLGPGAQLSCQSGRAAPCTVLDPFCGSGTVGVVCARENRAFIGIELNLEYVKMGEARIGKVMRVAEDDRRQGVFPGVSR